MVDEGEIRPLEHYYTFVEAGERLGVSRAAVWALVFEFGLIPPEQVRWVPVGKQALYLVHEDAVQAEEKRREDKKARAMANKSEAAELLARGDARRRMRALFGECDIWGKAERIRVVSEVLGREVDDWYNLSTADADAVSRYLLRRRPHPQE